MDEYTNYLVHHGIKGMHWGVRRYQNADGSLTSAGRKRYGVFKTDSGDLRISERQMKKANKLKAKGKSLYFKTTRFGDKVKVVSNREAKELDRKKAAYNNTPEGKLKSLMDKYDSDPAAFKKESEKYKAIADYMDQTNRISRNTPTKDKGPSKVDRLVSTADKTSKIVNSLANIYTSYNKAFGGPSEMDKINLQKARNELANSSLNLQRTQTMVDKLNHEYQRSLNDEAWNTRIQNAKKSTIFRSSKLSDEKLKEFTARKKVENDFIDAVFYQYDKVKK